MYIQNQKPMFWVPDPSLLLPQALADDFPAAVDVLSDTDPPAVSDDDGHQRQRTDMRI